MAVDKLGAEVGMGLGKKTFTQIFFAAMAILTAADRVASGANEPAVHLITFDATTAVENTGALPVLMGGKSPGGREINANRRFLTLDGKPWLPVMGEFQYSRYPEKYWDEELLKMKAAGVQIVATYVFWIHHEEVEGEFEWSGRRDLRRFAELCAKNELFLVVRIGPYAHGEVRNGGLPDWVVKKGPTRRNNPDYLAEVTKFYQEIGRELRGQLWKDGGCVIGVQLENEYFGKGADAGAAHISELKRIALQSGLETPLYTVTGWGGAEFPPREVIPVFGVYPDAFWESSLKKLPPSEGYLFSFRRDLGGIATDPLASGSDEKSLSLFPYFLAEAGGGMQVAYHRRPVISADDVAALLVTHLGAGANLYGYYVFQGGSNPLGKHSTMQESAAVDGVYDLPVISYDFQAPLGEFGQVRPAYRTLKAFNLFLRDFGGLLATMRPVKPDIVPSGSGDLETPRVAARVGDHGGFLFFNNHVRDYPMHEQENLRVQVKLPAETITLPRQPFAIPPDAYFLWPLNLDMRGVLLKYATAQLLCTVESGGEAYYFFFAQPGIAAEFAFEEDSVVSAESLFGAVVRADGRIYFENQQAGTLAAATVVGNSGQKIHLVLLSREQAGNIWKVHVGGRDRVLLSGADVFVDGDVLDVRARDAGKMEFSAFPALADEQLAGTVLHGARGTGIFASYSLAVAPIDIPIRTEKVRAADPSEAVKRGKYNALAPTDQDFARAAEWRIRIPGELPQDCGDLFLELNYQGDVARLYRGGALLADDFYRGATWELGLKRFMTPGTKTDLELKVLPLRKDAPIFLEGPGWPSFPSEREVDELKNVKIVPEYEVRVPIGDPKP